MPCNWENIVVLIGVAVCVAGFQRRLLALSVVILFTLSFPPYSFPAWWFCLTPLVWLWRNGGEKRSLLRVSLEAVAIGFAMCWVSTGFVRAALPAWGWLVHAVACLVFSLQFVGVSIVIWRLRGQCVPVAAAVTASASIICDVLEALFGVSWPISNLALTVGATPLAQWSRFVTPFGVSGALCLVNFLLTPEQSPQRTMRWAGPTIGIALLSAMWCGGLFIATNTTIEKLPFSAILVQPHIRFTSDSPFRPWLELDRLTQEALRDNDGTDLVVWPETSLSESWADQQREQRNDPTDSRRSLHDHAQKWARTYRANSLVGVVVSDITIVQKYGLDVSEVRPYNCGCLVNTSGEIQRHEKLALVPLKESLPAGLDFAWARETILPLLKLDPRLKPGRDYHHLSFTDRAGSQHVIAVSVCYESLLPWLPQYRDSNAVEAVIHLVYDGYAIEHPGVMQRHIRACQYRAIETRKWNLVCSTWLGTTIIDPRGQIVRQLPATAGILNSDSVRSE